jgi:hypothetical protein
MNKYSLQLRFFRIILSSLLLLSFALMTSEKAWSQGGGFTYPQVPLLSLTGTEDGYNQDWYPNGYIIQPIRKHESSAAGNREFLMPVFIDNKWWHYKSTDYAKYLVPEPIYSFKFKIVYNGKILTPVDIVTVHPFPDDDIRAQNIRADFTPPLAKDFNITWDTHADDSYLTLLVPDAKTSDREKGRVIVITGSGTKPLPCTDTTQVDYNVLLYVKFRINYSQADVAQDPDLGPDLTQPVYISHDTIMYNDWNVREEIAFKHLLYSDSVNVGDLYPDPLVTRFVGIRGINNETVPSQWATRPCLPGVIYHDFLKDLPKFDFWSDFSREGSQPPMWNWEDHLDKTGELGLAILRDPVTVDSGKVHKPDYVYGSIRFKVKNGQTNTRMTDIWVESDAPWLTFKLECDDRGKIVQIDETRGYINYIDDGILGGGVANADPLGEETDPDVPVWLNVNCDPDLVVPHNGEKAGIYTGYITFRSQGANITPARIKVTFINFRNPFEPDDGTVVGGQFRKEHRGIDLTIRNSRGMTGDETIVVFGTGHRATDAVDTLFGEFPYPGALSGFGARFYHPDEDFRNEHDMPFGFGDMLPNRENPYSESRDIRDINDTNFSHVYLCRFDANGVQNYPIVVEWDTTDFPEGAQIFLSDTLNGALFPSVNMRQSTHVAGNILSYSIQDPKITSFKIEYTLPRVIDYVDAYGNPRIKTGWNLLSLPVRPKNLEWNVVYPEALNEPYCFFGNGYLPQRDVKPGIGYFIKYSDSVDKKFKGVPMKRITKELGDDGFADEIHIYPGWNTIGALSFAMNVKDVLFDRFSGSTPIDPHSVRSHGFWGYRNNVGYYEASILEPGLGYWIKTQQSEHGYLKLIHPEISRIDNDLDLSKQNVLNNSLKMTVRDNAQHEYNLYLTNDKNVDLSYYELPPLPPYGLFDVRFNSNRIIASENTNIIKLQGVDYPVSIAMNNADANYTFIDAYSGQLLGSINKGESKNIEIKSTISNSIKILKSENVAGGLSVTNYPNPVVSTSTVKYSVPNDGQVNIKLYDAIGNSVTLFDGWKSAGEYTETLDAVKLASGSYLCKITSGSNTATVMITIVK